jgi:hypothetical protein
MNMTSRVLLSIAATLISCACMADQLAIKTGLWEVTSVTTSEGMPLSREVLATLTPQQRASIAASAKERAGKPERDTTNECITEQDLREPFRLSDAKSCTQSIVKATSTAQEVHMDCAGERPQAGTLRILTPTPTTMTGTMNLRTGEGSDAFVIKATLAGRWLSADCGDEADDALDADEDDGPADDTEEEE